VLPSEEKSPNFVENKVRFDKQSFLIVLPRNKEASNLRIDMGGVQRLGRGLFLVASSSPEIKMVFSRLPHYRFRRVREIPKIRNADSALKEKQTYALVAYRFSRPTAMQKKQMQRIIRKTQCVRLRPGVLLFPHLRAKELAKQKSNSRTVLRNSKDFAIEALEIGAAVARWTRLKLVNDEGREILLSAIEMMVTAELGAIENRFKSLAEDASGGILTRKKARERFSVLQTRFNLFKSRMRVLQDVWQYGTEKQQKRTYNIMLRVRKKIDELPETTLMPA